MSWTLLCTALPELLKVHPHKEKIRTTFVIPTLNMESYLPLCLDAIGKQTVAPDEYEIIVVDNGSTDRTVAIARKYGAFVLDVPGKSIAALRNRGAEKAQGEFIAFIDADCIISSQWLANAIRHFHDPKVAAVGAYTTVPDDATWVESYWSLQNRGVEGVFSTSWLPSANLFVKKIFFMEIGGFNENLETCEDSDFGYRLSNKYSVLSDFALVSVHLRDPKTIGQFYRKEKWRGKGNLRGLFSHGIVWDEMPSMMLPFYYFFAFLAMGVSFVSFAYNRNCWPCFWSLLIMLLPILLLSLRTGIRAKNALALFPLFILYFVYATARTAALFSSKTTK
ncbi:MAG: glycosyltransferase [Nitrospirales bacterium]|nr:glycosyltransferase [Nitrospirales bacterium]